MLYVLLRVKPRGVSAEIYDEMEEPCERIQAKDREQKEDQKRPKTSIVQSLVSPPGTHPSPSASPKHSLSPERYSHVQRKYSLIQEESLEDDDEDDMDAEDYGDLRSAKSAESLDDSAVHRSQCSPPTFEMLSLKRPLVSVASSPQLLNQICEEHESDEEDDIVPSKLHSPRLRLSRNSATSPEIIRKYGQRKKRRGAGSRGASCSSSDASDTDDTEGRSRKDKIIKHKFMHRRDSSDHSSDTDGGPPGPTGGSRGGGPGLGGGHSKDSHGKDKKGGGGGGSNGGKGHRDGKGGSSGSQGSKQNSNNNQLRVLANNRNGENAINSAFSNLSLSSINSKNSLKYIVEKSECEDDDEEGISMKSTTNSNNYSLNNNVDKPTEMIVTDKENNTLLHVNTGPICSTNGCVMINLFVGYPVL
ncbi:hypothetical protein KUTeg_019014 [Tegillarca granosa]|uniref:Uncharacterized protein n=1 Tax=Tegillarca granosa TaxID=220873 RepID=A0ABQ9EBA7_TEGGR|nr:hypothetical protein KUTeg_019014 [Tegillarca granosa]